MRFEESVVINRPPEEVWTFWTDWFNTPRARPGALGLRPISPGPPGVGSVLQGRATVLGLETRFTLTITEWDPPRTLGSTLAGRPIRRYVSRIAFQAIAGGTRVNRTTEFEPHPALRLIWPLFERVFKRQQRAVVRNMKRMIEATPPSGSERP